MTTLLARGDLDVAEGDRAVVALEHQRAGRRLLAGQSTGRLALHLDVLVQHDVVERDLDELGVGDLLVPLELRGLELDDELLPLARLLGRVLLRRRGAVERPEVALTE